MGGGTVNWETSTGLNLVPSFWHICQSADVQTHLSMMTGKMMNGLSEVCPSNTLRLLVAGILLLAGST